MNKRELVKEILLDDIDLTLDIIHELNFYNDTFYFLMYYNNDEDFFENNFNSIKEIILAVTNSDYYVNDDYVIINVENNELESYSKQDVIKDVKLYIDDVIEESINTYKKDNNTFSHLRLPSKLIELLEDKNQ